MLYTTNDYHTITMGCQIPFPDSIVGAFLLTSDLICINLIAGKMK